MMVQRQKVDGMTQTGSLMLNVGKATQQSKLFLKFALCLYCSILDSTYWEEKGLFFSHHVTKMNAQSWIITIEGICKFHIIVSGGFGTGGEKENIGLDVLFVMTMYS